MHVTRAKLSECAALTGAVVVIDVLRSFTTAAYAFAAGARAVLATDDREAALALGRSPDVVTMGSAPGGATLIGFDAGNSPSAIPALSVRGRTVVLQTAGGIRGLVAATRADVLLAGSLVCARATAAWLLRARPTRIALVVTGEWTDRNGDEDHACADYLEALVRGQEPDPAPYVARVRNSDFARRFGTREHPALPLADLDCCVNVDRVDFAMVARPAREGVVLQPVRASPRRSAVAGG
jgi:2-phosphosulfolactate phosphatase